MWHAYDLGSVFYPAAAIFLFTATVSLRATGSAGGALTASLIKTGLFVWYFSVSFDGTYTILDDQTYFTNGLLFHERGLNFFNIGDYLPLLMATADGLQFGYYIYNAFAIDLFGSGYFAPVAFNILITVLVAFVGTRLAKNEFGLSDKSGVLFYYYLLLFPNIMAWSTAINGKDVLVLFVHVVLLYGFSLWLRNRIVPAFLLLIPTAILVFFLRFYVPLLFSVAFAASSLIAGSATRRVLWLTASGLLMAAALAAIGPAIVGMAWDRLLSDFTNPVVGFIHILLTPIPLNTETNYGFLEIPAALHWILLPLAAIGVLKVYRLRTPFSRFFVVYFVVFIGLYSVYGELQGPRHRLQLDYAWAVFQFLGLLALVNEARAVPPSRKIAGVPAE